MITITELLARLHGVHKTANGWEARCPAHDDRQASLSIAIGDDRRVLLHCHAGCPIDQVCASVGLRLSDLMPPSNGKATRNGKARLGKIVATYDYRDASGTLLYQVVRFHPKDFHQRRPDGKGGWIWNLQGVQRVLYRLPELLAAPADAWVIVVEGEKDADNLAKLGFVATTAPQGAGKWDKVDDSPLHGRKVCIIPDRDEPGTQHAQDVVGSLYGKAATLRVLELPLSRNAE